jgi:hypothetical protein
MGMVIMARNHAGSVLVTFYGTRPHVRDQTSAETMWQIMELCVDMGWWKIILEGDTLEIIQHLQRTEDWWGSYDSMVKDAKLKLSNFVEWRVEHLPCEANEKVHRLAKLALSLQGKHLWVDEYPLCIQPYVLVELHTL